MERTRLGRTGLMVGRTAFGALPIQRLDFAEARAVLRRAFGAGINFFDTARGYSDSEEKIGEALGDVRGEIVLATKSFAGDREGLLEQLGTSLRNMKTDYVDILHAPHGARMPQELDDHLICEVIGEIKKQGKARFLGASFHSDMAPWPNYLPDAIGYLERVMILKLRFPKE